jgi:phage FluMu protein gp41
MSMDSTKIDMEITGTLAVGLPHGGTRHREFVLRAALAGDTIGAQVAYPDGPYSLIAVDQLRRQLVRVGTIPPEQITTDYLTRELLDLDYKVIQAAERRLEKKLMLASSDSSTGDASSTSLSDTDID